MSYEAGLKSTLLDRKLRFNLTGYYFKTKDLQLSAVGGAANANLLLNATAHTPSGTPVEVQALLEHGRLILSVADRGPGIPPDVLPRIFDKFFRVTGAPAGGSGLGLTIVKGFAEAHDGSVTAENRPSGGAIFTLRLPQAEKPPAMEAAA